MNLPEPIVLIVGGWLAVCLICTALMACIVFAADRRKARRRDAFLRELLEIENAPVDIWAGFEEARHRYENEVV